MKEAKHYLYRNLHKNMFSIKYKQKVILRNNFQIMKEVNFIVHKNGQEKVRLEKRKNVHAMISGYLVNKDDFKLEEYNLIELYYNPYITNTFIIKDTKKEIFEAKFVLAKNNRIFLLEKN